MCVVAGCTINDCWPRAPHRAQASECGCLDAVLELMRVLLAANGGGKENGRGGSAVQRQACMAIRNIAVR